MSFRVSDLRSKAVKNNIKEKEMSDIFERMLKKANSITEKKKLKPKSKNFNPYHYYSKTEINEDYWNEYTKQYYEENDDEPKQ